MKVNRRPAGCASRPRQARRAGRTHRAEADLFRRVAVWLRDDPAAARQVGLPVAEDARALAALLNILAASPPFPGNAVRRQALRLCRAALGETATDRPLPQRRPRQVRAAGRRTGNRGVRPPAARTWQ